MEYCCCVWAGAINFYLDNLDSLQKCVCKYIGAVLSDSLEPVAQPSDEASLCLFYIYCFGKKLD